MPCPTDYVSLPIQVGLKTDIVWILLDYLSPIATGQPLFDIGKV